MVKINEIMFYGRYYSDEKNSFDILWWLCLDDFSVYDTETLLSDYSYQSLSEIRETLRFIPFFKTDIIQLEKKFIDKLNNKKLRKVFEKILLDSNHNYDVTFKVFIEREFMVDSWSEFEKSQLRKDAIVWCKMNRIPYSY